MSAALALNAVLALAVELAALAGLAGLGLRLGGSGFGGLALAGLFVAAFVALWGRFAAPKSRRRLDGPALVVFKLAMFDLGGLALWGAGHPLWGGALVAAGAAQVALARRLQAL